MHLNTKSICISRHHQYLSRQLMINSSSSLCVKNQTFLFASSPSMPTAIFKSVGLKWSCGRGGGLMFWNSATFPYLDFPKCPLRRLLAQANVSPIFTVNLVPRFLSKTWERGWLHSVKYVRNQFVTMHQYGQLFRWSCFMVLLREFLSRLRAENVRS